MKQRLTMVVSGRVQGVGFRQHVKSHAMALGLAGYVYNNIGGTVYVCAEGPRDKLKLLADAVAEGTSRSRVDSFEMAWSDSTGEYRGRFAIR